MRVSSIVLSLRRTRPEALPSTVKKESPSSPREPGRRATTTSRSAVWPSSTKLLVPSSRQVAPDGDAVSAMLAASVLPLSSAKARVAVTVPSARPGSSAFFCSSVPAFRIAVVASAAVEKNGAQSRPRPISSSTMAELGIAEAAAAIGLGDVEGR